MTQGTLEVLLVSAKNLQDTDFLSNMDPYVIITCRTQEQRSSITSGRGTEPEWNETFVFSISNGTSELMLKIMDKDTFTGDDFVGQATIPLESVFIERSIPPISYRIVKDQEYLGQIKVGLTFIAEEETIIKDSAWRKRAMECGKNLNTD